MKKCILIFCLVLALCLSMIPAASVTYAAQPAYTVIATGVEATGINIMDNGYCAYEILDGYMIPYKGVIAPSGKAIVTRDFRDDPIYMGVMGSRYGVGCGSIIVDLPIYVRTSADGEDAWEDMAVYNTDGQYLGDVTDIIEDYAGPARRSLSYAYYGNDGYLTVSANIDGFDQGIAYVIDVQERKVVFSQKTFGDEIPVFSLGGVGEGLIPYSRTVTEEGENGETKRVVTGGWMDLNGKQVISIDSEKYVDWESFSNGRAVILKDEMREYGYLDKTGREVIPCIYSNARMFMDGYAAVETPSRGEESFGYIDTAGNPVIPFQYEDALGYGEGLFTVGKRTLAVDWYITKYGMVDIHNAQVVPFEYDDITPVKNGAAYAIKDGKVFVLKFANAEPEPQPAPSDPNDVSNIFRDVPAGVWYAKYLQKAYDKGIVGGTGAGAYSPDSKLTHAQIMVIVANLHSLQKNDGFKGSAVPGDHWAASFRDYCKKEDIIDARFDEGMDATVTRAEMAYYFANALTDRSYKDKKSADFSDMPKNGYDEYIMKLAKADIVGGFEDGTFRPGEEVTRAQAAVFIGNIIDAIGE